MSQQKRIVCTGNEAFGLEVRRLVLESFGYHTRVLPDCATVSEAITRDGADLVVLDYSELTNEQTDCIRALRAEHPAQRILLIAPVPYLEENISALVDCVLLKGAPPEEFREAIHACIGGGSGGRKKSTIASFIGAFVGAARTLLKRRKAAPVTVSAISSSLKDSAPSAEKHRSSAR